MPNQPVDKTLLPRFSAIVPNEIKSTINDILDINRHRLKELLAQKQPYTWENLMEPLEEMGDELQKNWAPVAHLHGVMESEALRKAYNETIPILTEYSTELSQNETLFRAIEAVAEKDKTLNAAQKKLLELELRDFKLAGINLPEDKKAKMAGYQLRLSELTTKFSENVLDATDKWFLQIDDLNELKGLPEQALDLAKENARKRNLDGYVLTMDFPSYSTALKFLENRQLRQDIYKVHSTRASELGPFAGKYDNAPVIDEILQIKDEIAKLVGFNNFAEYSLATKMAGTPEQVISFIEDLVNRSKAMAKRELDELKKLAEADGIKKIEIWDVPYYSEKLRIQKYDYSQEDLRPYFPIKKVLQGLFTVVEKIYGIRLQQENEVEVYHPDVKFFSLYDDRGNFRGGLYMDLYARPHKRDGAWMDDCVNRRIRSDGNVQFPIAFLTCNFMPAVENKPGLLTFDDVLTLFHEFGHCLHHLLTKVDYASLSGINGVPWDAVEFPSQFMENFCYDKSVLPLISEHYETGQPIPDALFKKVLKAKHFQTGLQMLRQLEFALFDFKLHLEYDPNNKNFVQQTLDEVRKQISIVIPPSFNRFQNSFSHIFAGGYAAGYYSYKWAEVLSSDAYSLFEENGVLDPKTGHSFMQNILEVGGVRDPMDSFIAFRGRKPNIDALLRHSGIAQLVS